MASKKVKPKSKPKSRPKPAPGHFLARMNGAKDKLFKSQTDALAYVEHESKAKCLSGCQVVEFNAAGEQVYALSLNLKLESTYVWSNHV